MAENSAPEVDVIILSYLDYGRLQKCADSVLASTYPNMRLAIADNGSGPNVIAAVKERYSENPKVSIIENRENLGYAEGNNVALRATEGKYCVILNNDAIVDRNWLEPMVEYLDRNAKAGACQPKILDIKDPRRFEHSGAAGGYLDRYGYPFMRGRLFDTLENDEGQYDDHASLDWCSGTAFMAKREVLEKVGLFDPIYFMYGEENDLCWRIKRCGYDIAFVPRSKVYHEGMGSIGKRPLFKLHLNYRNNIILLMKNFSLTQLVAALPVRMALDAVNILYFMISKPMSFRFISIIWAYCELAIMLPRITCTRMRTQRLFRELGSESAPQYPMYRISVVFQYFLLGRKKFSQLKLRRA